MKPTSSTERILRMWLAGATIAIFLPATESDGAMQRGPDAWVLQAGGLALTGTARASGLCFNAARDCMQRGLGDGNLSPPGLLCGTGSKVAGPRADDTLVGCRRSGRVLGAVSGSGDSFMHSVHQGSEDPRRTLLAVRGGAENGGAIVVAGVVDVDVRDLVGACPVVAPRRTNVKRKETTSHGKESPRRSKSVSIGLSVTESTGP